MERDWNEIFKGVNNAHRTFIVNADEMTYTPLQAALKDLGIKLDE